VCAQWHWLERRVLIPDNEMDGKTLLLLSGCETWWVRRWQTQIPYNFRHIFLTDASNNTNNSPENENASAPTPHHLYCRHLKYKRDRYAAGSNLATQQKYLFDVLLLRLYFLFHTQSFTTSMPSPSRSRTIRLRSI